MKLSAVGAAMALAATLSACGSSPSGPLKSPPARIVISGPDSLAVGDTVRFTSIIFDEEGDSIPGLMPAWRAESPDIATSLGGDRFVGTADGQTQITAWGGELSASRPLTVWRRGAPSGGR